LILLYHFWVYVKRSQCQHTIEIPTPMFITALLTIPTYRISHMPRMDEWRTCDAYTKGALFSQKEEKTHVIFKKMDGTVDYDVRQNKSERHMFSLL
jgi:hypothetical protein